METKNSKKAKPEERAKRFLYKNGREVHVSKHLEENTGFSEKKYAG